MIVDGENYRLILGDCMDVMRDFSDNQFEVCITDPPYGIGENRAAVMSRENLAKPIDYGEFDWDSQPATAEQIARLRAVSKNQVIFGGNYFVLPPSPGWIVWDKLNGENDFSDCELAWTSYKRGVRIIRYLWNGMMKQHPEKRYHPTQKPIAVMRWIIANYTKPGDTIIDPFSGSFTTGAAAIEMGRKFVGIEIDKRQFDVGVYRLELAAAQPMLPGM